MATPTLNGLPLFGAAPVTVPTPHEARWQITEYPGVNGREAIFLGHSGGYTYCTFHLITTDEAALAALEANWITLQTNGALCVLTDTLGRPWPDVIVRHFRRTSLVENYGAAGVGAQYEAFLEHLI